MTDIKRNSPHSGLPMVRWNWALQEHKIKKEELFSAFVCWKSTFGISIHTWLKKKSVLPSEKNIYSLLDPWPTGFRYLNRVGVTTGLNMLTTNSCGLWVTIIASAVQTSTHSHAHICDDKQHFSPALTAGCELMDGSVYSGGVTAGMQ